MKGKMKNGEKCAYALKRLKKQHVVETRQQEHVFNEKKIMMTSQSQFITKYCCTNCLIFLGFFKILFVYFLSDSWVCLVCLCICQGTCLCTCLYVWMCVGICSF